MDLKPCPFCGGSRLENCTDDGRHWVRCMGCDATGPLGSKYDEDDDEDWNTRAAPAEARSEQPEWGALRLATEDLDKSFDDDFAAWSSPSFSGPRSAAWRLRTVLRDLLKAEAEA